MGEQDRRSGWEWPKDPPLNQTHRWLSTSVWPVLFLFYLIQPVVEAFRTPHPGWYRLAVIGIIVVYAVSYLWALSAGRRSSPAVRMVAGGWLFLMPVLLAVVGGSDLLVYWTYAIAAVLILFPRNIGVAFGFACAALLLVSTTIELGSPHWDEAMLLVVMTMAMFAFMALNQTVFELRAARDQVAELAKAEERDRLSRDLHDVLGHSLTTITVKAGLARRVLESRADTERAIAEVSDVERLSRQALTEVRATVSGYRSASLPAELAGARAALQAAEITADLPHAVDNVPVQLQEPFAYVLREGVTNVIRHSGARRCEVRLGETWIEIRDDGTGPARDRDCHGGHGLTGLAERLAPLGGTLDAGCADGGGFRLRATVPHRVGAPA